MGLINPVISSSHIFQSGSLREHISLLGSKPADFHFIMNELRLNAEIKSYEWFSFAHISWPTFSNLMSVPKAASAGFYTEEFHINSLRVLSGAGEWCSAQRWHWIGEGGGGVHCFLWSVLKYYHIFLTAFPAPLLSLLSLQESCNFFSSCNDPFWIIYFYIWLCNNNTHSNTRSSFCARRADGAAAAAAFASSAEANNSLTVLSLSSTERGREGWKWKERRGESETRREGEIKSREMDETGKGSEGGVGWGGEKEVVDAGARSRWENVTGETGEREGKKGRWKWRKEGEPWEGKTSS